MILYLRAQIDILRELNTGGIAVIAIPVMLGFYYWRKHKEQETLKLYR